MRTWLRQDSHDALGSATLEKTVVQMKNMVGTIKRSIKQVLTSKPLDFLSRRYSGLATCLVYHRVIENEGFGSVRTPASVGLQVSRAQFEEQMRYLSEHHHCIPLDQAVEQLANNSLRPGSVAVTFDDGYRDNLSIALPVLEKYHIPATIFITTGFVDRSASLWWYEQEFHLSNLKSLTLECLGATFSWPLGSPSQRRSARAQLNSIFKDLRNEQQQHLMQQIRNQSWGTYSYDDIILNWDEILKLDQHELITIGAHTMQHPVLRLLDNAELKKELGGARDIIEQRVGHSIKHMAYPFGESSQAGLREYQAASELGFSSAVTTSFGHLHREHRSMLTALPRVAIDYFDTLEDFKWKLKGFSSIRRPAHSEPVSLQPLLRVASE